MANGITDPTGGAPNFNIYDVFESFGYTPTQAEINALAPSFEGRTNVGETGSSAVANYVQAHQQISGAQSLIQGNMAAEAKGAANANALGAADQAAGTASYNQAQSTLEAAPKLFGSLTPDQISQYLAPLQSQFNYGLGQTTGQAASRGLAGSSLEAQAMAQVQGQFQQNVLNQGLSIGQQQQQLLANSQQALGAQQFGASAQQYGLAPQYLGLANQSAGQNYTAATDMAQLPGQEVSQALAQQALLQQMNAKQASPWGSLLGTGLGAAVGSFGGPMGAGIGASLGGQIGSAITGNPAGANVGGSLANTTLLASLMGNKMSGFSSGRDSSLSDENSVGGLQLLGNTNPGLV